MDEIGEFIMNLTGKQEPQYQEIGRKALESWNETGVSSPKMARWIQRSAKIHGMKMPDEVVALIRQRVDDVDDEQRADLQPPSRHHHCAAQIVLLRELSLALARAAERLSEIMQLASMKRSRHATA